MPRMRTITLGDQVPVGAIPIPGDPQGRYAMAISPIEDSARHGEPAISVAVVTTTPTLILPANDSRIFAMLINAGTVDVTLNFTDQVQAGGVGLTLVSDGGTLEDDRTTEAWWGVVTSGEARVEVLEVSG